MSRDRHLLSAMRQRHLKRHTNRRKTHKCCQPWKAAFRTCYSRARLQPAARADGGLCRRCWSQRSLSVTGLPPATTLSTSETTNDDASEPLSVELDAPALIAAMRPPQPCDGTLPVAHAMRLLLLCNVCSRTARCWIIDWSSDPTLTTFERCSCNDQGKPATLQSHAWGAIPVALSPAHALPSWRVEHTGESEVTSVPASIPAVQIRPYESPWHCPASP